MSKQGGLSQEWCLMAGFTVYLIYTWHRLVTLNWHKDVRFRDVLDNNEPLNTCIFPKENITHTGSYAYLFDSVSENLLASSNSLLNSSFSCLNCT